MKTKTTHKYLVVYDEFLHAAKHEPIYATRWTEERLKKAQEATTKKPKGYRRWVKILSSKKEVERQFKFGAILRFNAKKFDETAAAIKKYAEWEAKLKKNKRKQIF